MSNNFSSYEPGQIVRGIDLSVYRVMSKIAGPEGAVVRMANLNGEPVELPPNFTPIGSRMAHFASAMFLHLAYNKDFDLYVRAYCEQAGLPIPVGPDGQPFHWAEWLQNTIVPKLHVPSDSMADREAIKDEAIHEMLFNELGHRNVLSKFKSRIKKFRKKDPATGKYNDYVKNLPVAKQLTVYLTQIFKWRIEEMNRKIKDITPPEEESMVRDDWQGGHAEEEEGQNILETKEHSKDLGEIQSVESAHDISKFRNGFYHWLKKHQSEKSAKWFITLFDIYWQWVSQSGEGLDDEGRPAYMPARRHLEPMWEERTHLSPASLYEYIGRLAKLVEQYVVENRKSLRGENNPFVRLIDSIHHEREKLKRKKKTPVAAALASLKTAEPQTDEDIRPPKAEPYCDACDRLESNCVCDPCPCKGGHHDAAMKTAKLVRGDELTPEMRRQVLNSFPFRWTSDNPQRLSAYKCDLCDLRHPYINTQSSEGHTHPTIPLQTDNQWLSEHSFHFTNAGKLVQNRGAEPAALAGPGGDPVLLGQAVLDDREDQDQALVDRVQRQAAIEDDENACDTCGAEMEEGYCPRCRRSVQHGRRFDEQAEKEFQSSVPKKEKRGKPWVASGKTAEFGENVFPADEAVMCKACGDREAVPGKEYCEGCLADAEHPVCPRCLECTECNLRPCRGGGEHMPGVERSEAWRLNREMTNKQGSHIYRHISGGRHKTAESGIDLSDAVINILEARADQMLTAEDWEIFREAVETGSLPPAVLTAAERLLDSHDQQPSMVTPEEWDALRDAFQQETGRHIEWRHPDELSDEEFGEKQSTEPLQQLRPDITPGDTGRLPHCYKEGAKNHIFVPKKGPVSDGTCKICGKNYDEHSSQVRGYASKQGSENPELKAALMGLMERAADTLQDYAAEDDMNSPLAMELRQAMEELRIAKTAKHNNCVCSHSLMAHDEYGEQCSECDCAQYHASKTADVRIDENAASGGERALAETGSGIEIVPHEGDNRSESSVVIVVRDGEEEIGREEYTGSIEELIPYVEHLSSAHPEYKVQMILDEEGVITEDTWVGGQHTGETVETFKKAQDDASAGSTETSTSISTSTNPQQMLSQNVQESQGGSKPPQQEEESEAQRNRPNVPWNLQSQFAQPLRTNAAAITPQMMQTQNVQKSQGAAPPAPAQAPAPATPTGPPVAIVPNSGTGEEDQRPSRHTIPPELPNPDFHLSGSEELVDRKRFFASVKNKHTQA